MRPLARLEQIRNVLIVRIDHIGDILCSTPAMRCLRQGLPQAAFTLAASPDNRAVLEHWDGLDHVIVFDPDWPSKRKKRFARDLRRQGYDLSLVLSAKTSAYFLARQAGIPIRAGVICAGHVVPRLLRPLLLTHTLMMSPNGALKRGQRVLHEAEQALRLVAALGIPVKDRPLKVRVRPEDKAWASREIAGVRDGSILVGFHLSPKWLTQGWRPGDVRRLFTGVLDAVSDCTILVTFGPRETHAMAGLEPPPPGGRLESGNQAAQQGPMRAEQAARALQERFRGRLVARGGVSFGQWAGLMSLCHVVIRHDTGSVHLAAALRKPVVGVYHARDFSRNSQQFAPWRVPHRIIRMDRFERTCTAVARAAAELANSCNRHSVPKPARGKDPSTKEERDA